MGRSTINQHVLHVMSQIDMLKVATPVATEHTDDLTVGSGRVVTSFRHWNDGNWTWATGVTTLDPR